MKNYVIPGIVVISRQEKGPDGFCFAGGNPNNSCCGWLLICNGKVAHPGYHSRLFLPENCMPALY